VGVGFIQFFVREEEYFDGICIVNIRLCVRERKGRRKGGELKRT